MYFLFVSVLAGLLGAASAAPDKLPVGRRSGRQSDTGYGAPPETGYGSPGRLTFTEVASNNKMSGG